MKLMENPKWKDFLGRQQATIQRAQARSMSAPPERGLILDADREAEFLQRQKEVSHIGGLLVMVVHPVCPSAPELTLVKKVDQLLAESWQIVEEKQKHVAAIKDEMIKETMLCTEFARRQHDKSRKQSKGEASAERFKWSFACDMYCAEHLSFSVKSVRAGRESKGGEGWEDKC